MFMALCLAVLASCGETAEPGTYVIKGRVANPDAELIIGQTFTHRGMEVDSARVEDGKFTLTGRANAPRRITLYMKHKGSETLDDVFSMYVDNSVMKLSCSDSIKNAVVENSPLNDDYREWTRLCLPVTERRNVFNIWYLGMTLAERDADGAAARIARESEDIAQEEQRLAYEFIMANPHSEFAFYALFSVVVDSRNPNPELAKTVLAVFSQELRESEQGREYGRQIGIWERTSIGSTAPDFTQSDAEGNPVRLSDFRGRYVLLDFWASWCGPCRAENPHVRAAYDRYHSKGFDVIGVSLDGLPSQPDPRGVWLKAIEDDRLPWTNVSDLKGRDNEAARLYDINSIPFNFLISPEGKILEKNLRGRELQQSLVRYLGE